MRPKVNLTSPLAQPLSLFHHATERILLRSGERKKAMTQRNQETLPFSHPCLSRGVVRHARCARGGDGEKCCLAHAEDRRSILSRICLPTCLACGFGNRVRCLCATGLIWGQNC